jgi:hypothetical protein
MDVTVVGREPVVIFEPFMELSSPLSWTAPMLVLPRVTGVACVTGDSRIAVATTAIRVNHRFNIRDSRQVRSISRLLLEQRECPANCAKPQ